MFSKVANPYWLIVLIVVLAVGAVAWRFAFFVAPFWWTGEPARLALVLGIQPGVQVADIGAGSGALALEMAELVGPGGRVYATELDPERRAAIARRVDRASIANVSVIAAEETETRLPVTCCEAVYMRAVFHHIGDKQQFASDVVRALRPGGRVGVIDFAPGRLWFHGADHGVDPDAVLMAFQAAGLRLKERTDHWGGGMFILVFEGGDR